MALETGGLDAQVEQRMDAYRGNPQQLQQRYGANKELLDLLALQKLTSEKQAAARDMQMQQQQQPGTIAQQREQEALELTKQEMSGTLGQLAANTKGTLDQKQSLQQKNLNKMAQNASKPQLGAGAGLAGLMGGGARPQARPPARPPQGGGVEGMLMARNAQRGAPQGGPVRMAHGGIVSFAGDDGNNEVVGSPWSRWFKDTTTKIGTDMALQELRQKVKTKYGTFASPMGGLRNQSDAQQQYAKDVLQVADTLNEAQLLALAEANFTSGMTQNQLTALPPLESLPTGEQPPAEPSVDENGEVIINDNTNTELLSPNVTFEQAQPEDFLKDVDTSYTPTLPDAADKSGLDTATTNMMDQAAEVPTRDVVAPLKGAPLENVAAPYDEQGQEILRNLNKRYTSDMAADPLSAMQAAGVSEDAYQGRADKAEIYRKQEADERALQAETLDPDRLNSLARMQTLAGGRLGSGGIGASYVQSQTDKDSKRSTGLESLRGIQDTGVTTDMGIAAIGSQARQNAASRAEARRTAGMAGAKGLLADQDTRALQGQREQNAINMLNKEYEQSVSDGDFKAARDALTRKGAALVEVVRTEQYDVDNQVKTNLQLSREENEARKAKVEAELKAAKIRTDARTANNELLLSNEVELTKMLETRRKNVADTVLATMEQNPLVLRLNEQLLELSDAENSEEAKRIKGEIAKIRLATIEVLIGAYSGFADDYASMVGLEQRITQLQKANTALGSSGTRVDPNEVDVRTIQP